MTQVGRATRRPRATTPARPCRLPTPPRRRVGERSACVCVSCRMADRSRAGTTPAAGSTTSPPPTAARSSAVSLGSPSDVPEVVSRAALLHRTSARRSVSSSLSGGHRVPVTAIRAWVSVHVLSVASRVADPSVSTVARFRTMVWRSAIRLAASARLTLTTTGRDSGTVATARPRRSATSVEGSSAEQAYAHQQRAPGPRHWLPGIDSAESSGVAAGWLAPAGAACSMWPSSLQTRWQ
jgi:hypothetical protein